MDCFSYISDPSFSTSSLPLTQFSLSLSSTQLQPWTCLFYTLLGFLLCSKFGFVCACALISFRLPFCSYSLFCIVLSNHTVQTEHSRVFAWLTFRFFTSVHFAPILYTLYSLKCFPLAHPKPLQRYYSPSLMLFTRSNFDRPSFLLALWSFFNFCFYNSFFVEHVVFSAFLETTSGFFPFLSKIT